MKNFEKTYLKNKLQKYIIKKKFLLFYESVLSVRCYSGNNQKEYGSSNNASSNANLIPERSFEPNGNTTWLSSQSTEVTVSDNLTNSCVLLLMPVFEKY